MHLHFLMVFCFVYKKSKRTIMENEQLRKEVGYHTHQTEMLVQQNQKLVNELSDITRNTQLSKEVKCNFYNFFIQCTYLYNQYYFKFVIESLTNSPILLH